MSEPVDSKPPRKEPQGLTGDEVWGSLLRLEAEKAPLAPEQQRALIIRKNCITNIDSLEKLLDDPSLESDVLKAAETVASYWDSLFKLQDLGIKANMKNNQPIDFYRDPLNAAEYVAGQLVNVQNDNLPNARTAILEGQEHTTGNVSTDPKILQFPPISAKLLSSDMQKLAVLRSVAHITRFQLAAENT